MTARYSDSIFGVSGSIFSSHLIKYTCILETCFLTELNTKIKANYLEESLEADR